MTVQNYTQVKLGYSDPRTDTFGAHPLLGAVLDLNDGATYTLVSPEGVELSAPEKTLVPTGNVRTQGERVIRSIYRRNRTAVLRVVLGPGANYASFIANVRTLVRWLDAPPQVPVAVQWQPPTATSPVYLDVVGAAHGIPADEREWLRFQIEPIEIVLLVRPGLRGDRVTLQNLVSNPGFEAGSGPAVTLFNDSFATTNAYALVTGAAPSVSANVLTLPANAIIKFGSPAWGAINNWQLRFQYAASGQAFNAYLHLTDVNNGVYVNVNGSNLSTNQMIAGTNHALANASCALTVGSWYWLKAVQYPSAPGMPPMVAASVSNDSAGGIGSLIAATTQTPTFDSVTALSGVAALQAGGSAVPFGGAYSNVQMLQGFGPGGWTCYGAASGATGLAAGAWEQTSANTYAAGVVTSLGAARLDLPPAGTIIAGWTSYPGGAPAGSSAIPASAGQVLALSAQAKSTGLHATNASVYLLVNEFDTSGAYLRQDIIASKPGGTTNGGWTALAGTVTLGASCAYVGVICQVNDTAVSGESAGATVWFDTVQCWNQTTTGATSMPYCELRFPQSPAQLLVSGLLGDLPSPAAVSWGAFLSSWAPANVLNYALGRRAQASANAKLAGASVGYTGTALTPTSSFAVDNASYGGYKISATMNPSWNPRGFSFTPSDMLGVYHLFSRFQTNQAAGNLNNVETRVVTQQKSNPWFGTIGDADQVGAYNGPFVMPVSSSNTWTICDSGQVNVPALSSGALTDLTQNYLTPRSQWGDTTSGGSTGQSNWQMLLPIDGSLLAGVVNNPSNAGITVSNQWLWVYHDGLLVNRASVGDSASATYSVEGSPLPNPARGAGGPGTQSTGVINVNSAADPYLMLDPSVSVAATSTAAGGAGVNQLAGYVADNAGLVLPLYCELQYSPLYLYPR